MAAYFEGATVDDIYKALAYAETGTHRQAKDDPWTRTYKAGSGSSAYGPVGLTGGGGSDRAIRKKERSMMWNIYHNPKMAKDMKITEEDRVYISRFLEQADRFLDPVSDEQESLYGYAGPGVLRSDEDKALYERISKKIIEYEYGRHKKDIDAFIKDWRKKTENDVVVEDVEYNRKFKERLEKLEGTRALFPDDAVMEHALADKTRIIK